MKMFNLGVHELKHIRTRFKKIVELILAAMMKRVPNGFLSILGIQYKTGSLFSFSVILKPKSSAFFGFSSIVTS